MTKKQRGCGLFRSFVLFLIFAIAFGACYPGAKAVRPWLYDRFKQGVALYLQHQTEHFHELSGEHFRLRYTEADRDTAEFVLGLAERYCEEVENLLDYRPDQSERALLVVYPDTAALSRSIGWAGDKSAAGVYWAGSIRVLSPRAFSPGVSAAEDVRAVFLRENPLAHEVTHWMVDSRTRGNYTRWLTEGLAQYVEREITGFTLDEPLPEEKESRYPLDLLDLAFDRPQEELLAYWQALDTVDYLVDGWGMERVRQLLEFLGTGREFAGAFSAVYGFSLSELENRRP